MAKRKRTDLPANQNQIILNYLNLAFSDYLASRHLLRFGFLETGAMLASTTVEKYLKAAIGIKGIHNNKDHLGTTIYKLVRTNQPELYSILNKDFLNFLQKAFKLRYASTANPGISIVINQYKTLIELDELVYAVDRTFQVLRGEKQLDTTYRAEAASKNQELIIDNVALDNDLKDELLLRNNKVLEFKVEDNFFTLKATYETIGVSTSGKFSKSSGLTLNKEIFHLSKG